MRIDTHPVTVRRYTRPRMEARPPHSPNRRLLARTKVAALAALLAGCAALPVDSVRIAPDAPLVRLTEGDEACRTSPEAADATPRQALDPRLITLVNWNVQKGGHGDWGDQLGALVAGADVLTLQEAPIVSDGWRDHDAALFHACAPGFESRRTPTGVLTISDAAPLVQCNLQALEPVLRTPKATLVTEYALAGRDDNLLVVNMHVVNFTMGLAAFQAQLSDASDVVAQHRGPVILTGDFNTWSQARLDVLGTVIDAHGLGAVDFSDDARKRFLGKPLDHVYVRGLDVVWATTYETDTSDHNPMRVWLSAI